MKASVILTLLPFMASLVSGMEMDMDMDVNMDESEGSLNVTDLKPIAHRASSHHGVPILQTHLHPEERLYWEAYNTTTFFNAPSNKPALYSHISLLTVTAVFLYPITLVLQNVGSKWYLPALTLNLVSTIGSLFSLAVFGSSVEDMYPKNAYTRMSYILLIVIITHYVSAFVHFGVKYLTEEEKDEFIPLRQFGHSRGTSTLSPSSTLFDFNPNSLKKSFSIDAGRNSTAHSESTLGRINEVFEGHSDDSSNHQVHFLDDNVEQDSEEDIGLVSADPLEKPKSFKSASSKRDTILSKVFHHKYAQFGLQKFGSLASVIFNLINYPLFAYFLIYCAAGIAVGNLMGQSNRVFNLLAHFIKGGVFFLLGIVSLARYCGCWEAIGLAWTPAQFKLSAKKTHSSWLVRYSPMKGMVTMEFIESFLIFFYGSTNVFLEHLANPGGEWAAKDLQHVSIAFMYIGGGLCGLLTESSLSEWRLRKTQERFNDYLIQYGSPGYSPNPFPAITIFFTGIILSQHAQASQVSTVIHTQWGMIFAVGALVRAISYLNLFSGKPFTELVTALCLLAGGMIFMESTDQCVEALEYRGLTPMFTLNVSVGIVTLIMAWEMSLLMWRLWLKKTN